VVAAAAAGAAAGGGWEPLAAGAFAVLRVATIRIKLYLHGQLTGCVVRFSNATVVSF
jgi:hypothetical protein